MMKNQRQQCFGRLGRVLLFTVVLLFLLAAGFDFYYDLNDDTTIKDIISGAYTGIPDGYSIQMLYPLGNLIAVCYKAIPGVAWYGLFLCLCQFGIYMLIGYRLTGLSQNKKIQYGLLSLETILFAGLLFRFLVMLQYSITSGICMAGAIFLYITGKKGLKNQMIPILLVILSFMIRTELCLMMMPFLLVAGFFRMLLEPVEEEGKRADIVKQNLMILGIALLGMFAMKGMDMLVVNCSPEWKSFQAYFDARTKLYDFYGIPDYDENQDFYDSIGLTRESYTLLENYNFSLDEEMNADTLEQIVAYIEQNPESCHLHQTFGRIYTKKSISEALWLYQYRLRSGMDGSFGVCILLAYLFLVVLNCQREKGQRVLLTLQLICMVMARSVLWLYLLMVDRMLDRIVIPLYLGELITLLAWILVSIQTVREKKASNKVLTMILSGFVVCLTVTGIYGLCVNGKATREEYLARENSNPRWEALMEYCKSCPENYYLIDVYSSTSYQGVAYSEKIFKNVDNSYRNFDICGGWLAKSPLTTQKLAKAGIIIVEDALLNQGNTYFVAACDKEMEWMKAYYGQKGKEVTITRIDTVKKDENELFYIYEIK